MYGNRQFEDPAHIRHQRRVGTTADRDTMRRHSGRMGIPKRGARPPSGQPSEPLGMPGPGPAEGPAVSMSLQPGAGTQSSRRMNYRRSGLESPSGRVDTPEEINANWGASAQPTYVDPLTALSSNVTRLSDNVNMPHQPGAGTQFSGKYRPPALESPTGPADTPLEGINANWGASAKLNDEGQLAAVLNNLLRMVTHLSEQVTVLGNSFDNNTKDIEDLIEKLGHWSLRVEELCLETTQQAMEPPMEPHTEQDLWFNNTQS